MPDSIRHPVFVCPESQIINDKEAADPGERVKPPLFQTFENICGRCVGQGLETVAQKGVADYTIGVGVGLVVI